MFTNSEWAFKLISLKLFDITLDGKIWKSFEALSLWNFSCIIILFKHLQLKLFPIRADTVKAALANIIGLLSKLILDLLWTLFYFYY